MKILGYEDMIVGIVLGILMVIAAFTTPLPIIVLLKFFLPLFLILAMIDAVYELLDLSDGILWTIAAVSWNLIEISIVMAHIADIFKLPFNNIAILPVAGVVGFLGAGIFFILGNIMWLYIYFKH